MSDYLKVEYSEKNRPLTDYPAKLCIYLYQNYKLSPGMQFLEAGCGRGEFLKHFKELGLKVEGVDLSPEAPKYLPDISIKVCDIEKEGLPFPDNTFEVIYSKSLLEHFYYPELYVKEAFRVLKPGGLLLTLVPDWESNYKIYFDDYTHRSPFSLKSLEQIYKTYDFKHVKVIKFRQLPVVWKYPFLNKFCEIISPFISVRTENKFLRWSRELMLIGSGRK